MSANYGYFVGSIGIDPEYYLDEMSQDEMEQIMKSDSERVRGEWEQTRLISFYSFIAMQGTKQINSPKALFPLPWDNAENDKKQCKALTKDQLNEIYSSYLKSKKQ